MAITDTESHAEWFELFKGVADEQGLLCLGIVPLVTQDRFASYRKWIEEGRHGEMHYMEEYQEVRQNPSLVMDSAKSAVIFAFRYGAREDPAKRSGIAQYARLKDYHRFLKVKITNCEKALQSLSETARNWTSKVVVDTAPLLERALAEHTDQCFIGKNTCLIHARKGSYFLLGELIIDRTFDGFVHSSVNAAERTANGGCGTCRRCQVHCPTGALDNEYSLDARKCLSYWTIEHRGEIPQEFWPPLGKYWYGCDICQNVCPYNRVGSKPDTHELVKFENEPDLYQVATMDQGYYEKVFGGSPMTRAKISGLKRNALIAMHVREHHLIADALKVSVESEHQVVAATAKTILQVRRQK